MKEIVTIPRDLVNKLLHQAQSSPQAEVCGLIGLGKNSRMSCYPIRNTASESRNRFHMDPEQQINAMKTMRENHQELFAIYHSHPDGPAFPSVTDLQYSGYPDALQIIISLDTRGVLEMRAFRVGKPDSVEETSLVLETA